jgi:hypothetical protein
MRLLGLTLCLLASSLGARADSVEDRVAALEARVKALEAALQNQAGKPVALNAATIDGTYKATLPNGQLVTAEFSKGAVTVTTSSETKSGTYEIAGQRIIATAGDKSAILTVEGDHLRAQDGDKQIDFVKTK